MLLVPLLALGLVIAALGGRSDSGRADGRLSRLSPRRAVHGPALDVRNAHGLHAGRNGDESSLERFLPLNPAYGLIANFRAAALGERLDLYSLSVSLAVSVVMLLVGCLYFRRVERHFADII